MARRIKVSLLAPGSFGSPHPEEPEKSLQWMKGMWEYYYGKVLCDEPDLIVLPEASDRFESMSFEQLTDYYTYRKDEMLRFHSKIARDNHCYICYPTVWRNQSGVWHNSVFVLDRDGEIAAIYHKNYPTIAETEKWGIVSGAHAKAIETDFGKMNCTICFDLNFEELLFRIKKEQPKLLTFSSMYHGGLMQPYWAYTSRAYLAASVKGETSCILSPLGETIAKTTNYFPFVTAELNLDYAVIHLDYNIHKLEEAKKKYKSRIQVSEPGYVGAVLLTSEEEGLPVSQIVEEYELELWDDYYARSVQHRYDCMEEENKMQVSAN